MVEHVALKNLKMELKNSLSAPAKAGMKVTVDANHLKWLIDAYEKQQKEVHYERKD